MLDIFKEFATDATAESAGAEVKFKGQTFLIARSNNRDYGKMLTKLVNQHQRILDQKDEEADKKSDEIMVECMAHHILKGWKEPMVVERGGKPVEYSVENAKKALSIRDFRTEVMRMADERDNYRVKLEEEQEKN